VALVIVWSGYSMMYVKLEPFEWIIDALDKQTILPIRYYFQWGDKNGEGNWLHRNVGYMMEWL